MTKLCISAATEAKVVATIWNMADESLDTEEYECMEVVIRKLCAARNIDNELIAAEQIVLSNSRHHASDCRTSDAPAYVPAPCNCGASITRYKERSG